MIYVHTKTMVVDDRVAIIGSGEDNAQCSIITMRLSSIPYTYM